MIKKYLSVFIAALLAMLVFRYLLPWRSALPWSDENQKKYAATLVDRGLYQQAAREYQKLADSGNLSGSESANLSYMIGKIYMENLRDYENALAAFLKVKIYKKNTKLVSELDQKIVECLERTGRPYEAQKELDKLTLLDKPKELAKGTVVAKLGKREITMEELENQIKNLPPYMQKTYNTKDKQLEFLKQYLATELLYDAAKRRNFDKDKELLDQEFQIKKSLMVGKLMREEIRDKVRVSDSEIKLYYDAHKKDFKGKSLEEARNDVASALQSDKERSAQQEFISKMFVAERAEIHENLFK